MEAGRGAKRVGGWLQCKKCIHMYVTAKMIPVETTPEVGENKGER
jgi:hypothetical protein